MPHLKHHHMTCTHEHEAQARSFRQAPPTNKNVGVYQNIGMCAYVDVKIFVFRSNIKTSVFTRLFGRREYYNLQYPEAID